MILKQQKFNVNERIWNTDAPAIPAGSQNFDIE